MPDGDFQIRPSDAVAQVEQYAVCAHGAPCDLILDKNEGAAPPREIIDEIVRMGSEVARRYTSTGALEERIAAMMGIARDRVIVTAGGDDAIYRALKSVLSQGREIVVPVPSFEMIDRYARLAGGSVRTVPWAEGPYPIDSVIDSITDRTAAIAVVTPNNPTGLVALESDLRRLAEVAPRALLLVDLAYTEFAEEDLTDVALELPNAVVIRTLSKAWGLAGLRVGWAAGPEKLIGWMRAAGNPYAVSSASLAIASARLDENADIGEYVARVRDERGRLGRVIKELGGDVLPSQANFLLARFPNAEWVRDGLAGFGIAVRAFPGRLELAGCLRITMPGCERDFARLCAALETIFRPEALLLDIDDTLANVTESYRRATVETAKGFGANVSMGDIARMKAEGNANNDWELTWRLVQEKGIEVTLAEVTERFEEIYQGTEGREGLRKTERLLIDGGMLRRIAQRVRLGIVTGRPASDAMTFLEEQGIEDLFGAMVTMDDGPLKPDPAPVRKALEMLGVSRAWMVGDTPDDMRAARGAGVLPIGVTAPADEPEFARRMLTKAGAARVLMKLSQIEEILP